jgi:hypothetical protein
MSDDLGLATSLAGIGAGSRRPVGALATVASIPLHKSGEDDSLAIGSIFAIRLDRKTTSLEATAVSA